MDKRYNALLIALGIVYILLSALAFYNALKYPGFTGILWFSYTAFVLVGVGLLTRNSYLLGSQLNIIMLPYLFWTVDFFYVLITNQSLFGITDYFFASEPLINQIVSIQHIFIVPIVLFGIYLLKIKRNDFWKLSAAQVVIFFFLSRLFSTSTENINCAFENCLPFLIPISLYPFAWLLAYGIMIALTTLFLTKIRIFQKK